jgi:hypothetical protein
MHPVPSPDSGRHGEARVPIAARRQRPPDAPPTERVARFGSFVMTVPHPIDTRLTSAIKGAVKEIRADSRVVSISVPDLEEDWCASGILYPSPMREKRIDTWNHHLHWIRFNSPVRFEVEVPAKNQRSLTEGDSLPTRYLVLWDGMVIVTSWLVPAGQPIGLSGGHVVQGILEEALDRAGYELYVQECSPSCDHGYAHTTLRITNVPSGGERAEYVKGRAWSEVKASVPVGRDQMTYVFYDMRAAAISFTKVKNIGRHILDIEANVRKDLDGLLSQSVTLASLFRLGLKERTKRRWKLRRWRRESRRLIAELWLSLAVIERLHRRWNGERFDFDSEVRDRGLHLLFLLDHADDAARIESLDLGLIRSTVEEGAERIDQRALITVTGIAAVTGAICGALAAHLL